MTGESLELAMELGKMAEVDRGRLEVLCAAAERELAGRLREGVRPEDCGGAFPLAAAWVALGDLCVGECVDGVESFTAGGLTIRRGEKDAPERRGEALRRRGEAVLAPYLKNRTFAFQGVKG